MKSKLVIGLAAMLVVAGGVWWWQGRTSGPKYRELSLKRGDLDVTILATGLVQPQNQVDIKPPVNGRAEEVIVKEGAKVRRGQVLALMSSTERAALLDAARAKGPDETKRWEALYRATPILAPISGTIITRNIEPGQGFTSADAVMTISDRLTVRAQVDETDIGKIRKGQHARVVLDAFPESPLDARVDAIAFSAKTVNSVTTYEVDVTPKATPEFVRSGMTANVTFSIDSRKDVLLVPTEAIKNAPGGVRTVLVKKEGAAPEETEIDVGTSDGKFTEVTDGLDGKEVVLVAERRKGDGSKGKNPFAPGGPGGGGSRGGAGGGRGGH